MAERLGHVVIGAHLQAAHLVHLAGAGRQHDDRRVGEAPDLLTELEAVGVGKHDVEQDEVRLLVLDEPQSPLAGGGGDHVSIRPAEVEAEVNDLDHVRLIVNDQDFHSFSRRTWIVRVHQM